MIEETVKTLKFFTTRGLTQSEAKAYAPPDYRVTKHQQREFGWQLKYIHEKESHYKGFAENCVGEDNHAFEYVLVLAWRAHTRRHGEEFPYIIVH